jgi:pre-rRNA-processing protein TSR1
MLTILFECNAIGPLCLWPLFQFERRVSILHFVVKRHEELDNEPIKGKTPIEIHCGFRRFVGTPVYTQHNTNCDKHMIERFFHTGRFSVASVYARIMFPPAPVLFFRTTPATSSATK